MPPPNYIFLSIKLRLGMFECSSKTVHKYYGKTPDKFIHSYMLGFWDDEDNTEVDGNTYYWQSDQIAGSVQQVEQITYEEYQTLSKFL